MTIDELIKAANEYRKRYDITYSEGVILPLSSIMADFAAECVKDALALADAADNYCDRCGDIVQVNEAFSTWSRGQVGKQESVRQQTWECDECGDFGYNLVPGDGFGGLVEQPCSKGCERKEITW